MPKNVPIERHASELYTHTLFLEVQKEIYRGMTFCYIASKTPELDGVKIYTIVHTNRQYKDINEFEVSFDTRDRSVSCSCMGYTRLGYLCRHAFCVYRYNQVDEIPVQYQPGRWKRDILPRRVFSMSNRYSADTDAESKLGTVFFREFPTEPACNKTSAVISELLKQPEDMEVSINPPQGIQNKGCGTNHRLIGPGKKAVVNSAKTTRLCGKCKKYFNDLDSRNCEKVRAAKEAAAAATKAAKAGNVVVPKDSCHVGVVDLSNGDTSVGPSSRICTRATRRSTRRSTLRSSDPLEE
ncbi:protein FAR1-RELATED SEQUENCE 2-like [Helianthus annuus]|uniref:protein FAR1-RELATED SEQUENCE 2-like n=1 Tax=Helianthus annuus TaxID=4232 RepID=UPI000B906F6C|nr:protein FAR1-RELATED SEQUENCE 2-like [Helianthus annuus]